MQTRHPSGLMIVSSALILHRICIRHTYGFTIVKVRLTRCYGLTDYLILYTLCRVHAYPTSTSVYLIWRPTPHFHHAWPNEVIEPLEFWSDLVALSLVIWRHNCTKRGPPMISVTRNGSIYTYLGCRTNLFFYDTLSKSLDLISKIPRGASPFPHWVLHASESKSSGLCPRRRVRRRTGSLAALFDHQGMRYHTLII